MNFGEPQRPTQIFSRCYGTFGAGKISASTWINVVLASLNSEQSSIDFTEVLNLVHQVSVWILVDAEPHTAPLAHC